MGREPDRDVRKHVAEIAASSESSCTSNGAHEAEAGLLDDPATETEPIEERVNAETFLRQILADGEIPAETIWTAAREQNIAERTLKRVKARLGVKTERRGYGPNGQWFWSLPKDSLGEADRESHTVPNVS